MSTANKLTYLNTTKQNLKTVINTTGAGLTDESTFRSYANVLNDKILGAINGDVDLFEEYPKVSGNGTDLSLNGVVEGKMSITLQGVSSQDGEPTPTTPIPVKSVTGENKAIVCNENLWGGFTYSSSQYGVNYIYNYDGSITANGTATNNSVSGTVGNLKNNGIYKILTAGIYTVSKTNTSIQIQVYNADTTTFIGAVPTSSNSYTFTLSETTTICLRLFVPNGTTINAKVDIMLVKGSTAPTTYVEHEEQNYQLSLGNIELNSSPDGTIRDQIKGSSDVSYNLFDITQYPVVSKIAYSSSGEQKYWANYVGVNNYFLVKPSTTYNISNSLSETTSMIVYYDKQQNILSTQSNLNTFTTPSNAKYIRFCYYDTSERIPSWIQITEGSEAKPYFPYGQVGMWYKREYIGKVVLDGTNMQLYGTGGTASDYWEYQRTLSQTGTGLQKDAYSNYFSQTVNSRVVITTAGGLYLRFPKSIEIDVSNSSLMNEWLSTHNTIVYFKLAQYTDIPITDTTLINQLNNIYNNAHSYNGTTNITTTYTSGNEQMYLDIEALKNVWEVTE